MRVAFSVAGNYVQGAGLLVSLRKPRDGDFLRIRLLEGHGVAEVVGVGIAVSVPDDARFILYDDGTVLAAFPDLGAFPAGGTVGIEEGMLV